MNKESYNSIKALYTLVSEKHLLFAFCVLSLCYKNIEYKSTTATYRDFIIAYSPQGWLKRRMRNMGIYLRDDKRTFNFSYRLYIQGV